jgi:hypothetical protein
MARSFLASSYGGLRILVATIDTERGLDIVTQSPAHGNHHTLSVRGKKQRRTTCEILFVEQPGIKPFLDRYHEFVELAETELAQVFSHPIDGDYKARCGDLSVRGDMTRQIIVSCVFLSDDEPKTTFTAGAGVPVEAGLDAVTAGASSASSALVGVGIESDLDVPRDDGLQFSVLGDCVDTITRWTEATDLDSSEVFLGVAALTQSIDDAVAAFDLLSDVRRWQVYEQLIVLRYSIVRAGEAFTADTETVFDLFVDRPRPVIAICAELYGAAEAEDRARQVTKNNRISTPGLVPAGTTLKMPRPTS